MHCAVVIPCHNGRDLTAACVESLLAQDGDHDLDICLVDNGSTDDTASLTRMHRSVRCLRLDSNRGFAGGVNAGVATTTAPLVLVLNNDTRAAPNLVAELAAALLGNPGVGAVGPVSNYVKGQALLRIAEDTRDAGIRRELAVALADIGPTAIQDVDSLSGLCLMLRRTTMAQVGPFDECFGHGNFEDDDYCLRLRLGGHRLAIARRAFLHHEGHATFRAIGLDYDRELQRRGEQFAAKWRTDPAGAAHLAALRGDLAGAGEAAGAGLASWPAWPDGHWHRGRLFAARGEAMAAAREFARLLHACPRHSDAAIELATALLAAGRERPAQRMLAWITRNCYVSPGAERRLLVAFGAQAFRGGRPAAAAALFRTALAAAPGDGDLHNWLGSCLLALGELAAAEAEFEAAAAAGCAIAHTNLGLCALQHGDPALAGERFAHAVELIPADPVARRNRDAFAARFPALAAARDPRPRLVSGS